MVDLNDTLLTQIAISKAKGMHANTLRELLERIGTLHDFFTLSQTELHKLTGAKSEIFDMAYRQNLLEEAVGEAAFVRNNHIDTYFIDSEDYPRRLIECEDAPLLLYKLGSCDLNSAHTIGVVGTRHSTQYGIDFTTRLVTELAQKVEGLVVISGLAYGIDVAAHKAALSNKIPTIGVLAHALNTIYPADHRSVAAKITSTGGALLTEYPTTTRIHRSNFLARNRIVAGLCDCTVVVESDYRGGSMSTARIAMQYNRDVFAVPGRITDKYSRGTNQLIANHTASLLEGSDALIEQMGWTTKESETQERPTLFRALNANEQQLLDYLKSYPESTVNEICVGLNKSYAYISDLVFQLEMDDIVGTLPGGRITVNI